MLFFANEHPGPHLRSVLREINYNPNEQKIEQKEFDKYGCSDLVLEAVDTTSKTSHN